MKVGKEEIIGCLTALETWLNLDEKKIYTEWNGRVDRIRKLVDTVPGVKTDIYIPDDGNRYPNTEGLMGSGRLGASPFPIACRSCARTIRSSKCSASTIPAWCPRFARAIRTAKERKEADHIELVSMTIQPGRRNDCGTKIASDSERGPKKGKIR